MLLIGPSAPSSTREILEYHNEKMKNNKRYEWIAHISSSVPPRFRNNSFPRPLKA